MATKIRRYALDIEAVREKYGNFVTYPQAEEITSVSVRTLKRLTAEGQLPIYTAGRSRTYRIKIEDVVGLMRRVA